MFLLALHNLLEMRDQVIIHKIQNVVLYSYVGSVFLKKKKILALISFFHAELYHNSDNLLHFSSSVEWFSIGTLCLSLRVPQVLPLLAPPQGPQQTLSAPSMSRPKLFSMDPISANTCVSGSSILSSEMQSSQSPPS